MKLGLRKRLVFALAAMIGFPILVVFIVGNRFVSGINGITILIVLQSVSYIISVVVVSGFVAKRLLAPSSELHAVTKKIADGDPDFTIQYRNNDEMGAFLRSFRFDESTTKGIA